MNCNYFQHLNVITITNKIQNLIYSFVIIKEYIKNPSLLKFYFLFINFIIIILSIIITFYY